MMMKEIRRKSIKQRDRRREEGRQGGGEKKSEKGGNQKGMSLIQVNLVSKKSSPQPTAPDRESRQTDRHTDTQTFLT
eukprot:scaffold736_cov197-Ochromonas_danica.AAC.3